MGRAKQMKRKRNRPQNQGQSSESSDKKADPRDGRPNYKLTEKKNELLEEYYKNQSWLPAEEADAFFETLRSPLPATFRITGSNIHAQELLQFIKGEYFSKITDGTTIQGEEIKPPQCLPWYPNEQAWQMSLDRKTIRHHETLGKLHEFLVSETESGYISRQEAVSMIPPLLLDIKPHHTVLDMCAAPGSKTAQLIELLHAEEEATGKLPTGYVLANDADNKRCYLMMHQVKRLASPNFLIINHDATQLPNFHLTPIEEEGKKILKFDRILTDVPCSGDGTLRKNPDIWSKWHTVMAYNLHSIQRRILRRAAQQLNVGGRLVYSTCSMNPVEDEAVLCDILQECEGALQIVDVSDQLPGLKYSPGVSKWSLLSRDMKWYHDFESVPENLRTQIRPSMFPPPEEIASKLNLHRCLRILPHHQNTGGFFVCVLEKVKEVPWVGPVGKKEGVKEEAGEGEEKSENAGEGSAEDGQAGEKRKFVHDDGRAPPKKKMYRGFKEDPFVFLKEDDPVLVPVLEYFGVKSDFPSTQLLVRSHEGKKRNLYIVSKEIKNILECNQGRIKFINGGIKVFARSDSDRTQCDFRLVQDGMHVIAPFLSQRRVDINTHDLGVLMKNENPYQTKFSESTQTALEAVEPGGMYFNYEPVEGSDGPRCKLHLAGWQGVKSCRLFMARWDRFHFMRMLGFDPPTKKEHKDRAAVEEKKAAENEDSDVEDTNGIKQEEDVKQGESGFDAGAEAESNAAEVVKEEKPVLLSESTDLEEMMLNS